MSSDVLEFYAFPDGDGINIPGVDTEKGLSYFCGELDVYIPCLRSFAENTPAALGMLRNVSRETLPDYIIRVHGLKGTSATIGSETIRETAMALEKMARAGDLDGVLAGKDKLIEDAEKIVANINAWFEKFDKINAKPCLEVPDRNVLARLRQCCEKFDMQGIDNARAELEGARYSKDDGLVKWIIDRINVSELAEIAARLVEYEKDLAK